MAREKFENRHAGTTIDVVHGYRGADKRVISVTYARLPRPGDHPYIPTGRIGEFWVNTVDGNARGVNDDMPDTCLATSRSLQYGETVDQLARSVQRDDRGKPIGWLGSILDALKKEPAYV